MGQEALQAGDGVVEMQQGLIGIQRFVVKHNAGTGHVVGGIGAELREAQDRRLRLVVG